MDRALAVVAGPLRWNESAFAERWCDGAETVETDAIVETASEAVVEAPVPVVVASAPLAIVCRVPAAQATAELSVSFAYW